LPLRVEKDKPGSLRPHAINCIVVNANRLSLRNFFHFGLHRVLNASFRQALQWETILEVPTKGVKLPWIRRREMGVFSVEEAKIFLKFALPTMYGTLFAVDITTGMRPSEHIGLKWQNID
jgi:integrase